MTLDELITEEMVEAVASAEWEQRRVMFSFPPETPDMPPWSELSDGDKSDIRDQVRPLLEIAAPMIWREAMKGKEPTP